MGENGNYNSLSDHNHWVEGSRGRCPGCAREKEERAREDRKWWVFMAVCLIILVVTGWFQVGDWVEKWVSPAQVNGRGLKD